MSGGGQSATSCWSTMQVASVLEASFYGFSSHWVVEGSIIFWACDNFSIAEAD